MEKQLKENKSSIKRRNYRFNGEGGTEEETHI